MTDFEKLKRVFEEIGVKFSTSTSCGVDYIKYSKDETVAIEDFKAKYNRPPDFSIDRINIDTEYESWMCVEGFEISDVTFIDFDRQGKFEQFYIDIG